MTLKALIVDDEPLVRQATMRALGCEGFACDAAADGREARRMVSETRYDAVITDLRMPGENGHSLILHLLSEPDRPALVTLTGLVEERVETYFRQQGVDEVAFKPVEYPAFAARVRELAERRRRLASPPEMSNAVGTACRNDAKQQSIEANPAAHGLNGAEVALDEETVAVVADDKGASPQSSESIAQELPLAGAPQDETTASNHLGQSPPTVDDSGHSSLDDEVSRASLSSPTHSEVTAAPCVSERCHGAKAASEAVIVTGTDKRLLPSIATDETADKELGRTSIRVQRGDSGPRCWKMEWLWPTLLALVATGLIGNQFYLTYQHQRTRETLSRQIDALHHEIVEVKLRAAMTYDQHTPPAKESPVLRARRSATVATDHPRQQGP
jgi:DNA-binding response OmpR family regulator